MLQAHFQTNFLRKTYNQTGTKMSGKSDVCNLENYMYVHMYNKSNQ